MEMRKLLCGLLLSCHLVLYSQPAHLVISQVYGAGGNSGALFTHDFAELYNPSPVPVSLSGWSLQYSSAGGSTWNANKADLSGTISPGGYYLLQLGTGGSSGQPLPRPDFTATHISLSGTSGKLALVSNTAVLTGNCPAGGALVDFVGFGNADCSEGQPAPATSVAVGIMRAGAGCTDANNNGSDFATAVPGPRNSAAHAHTCNGYSISVTGLNGPPFCVDGAAGAQGSVAFSAAGDFPPASFTVVLSDANGSFANPVAIGAAPVAGSNPAGIIPVTIPAAAASGSQYRVRVDADVPALTGQQSGVLEIINGAANVSAFAATPASGQLTLSWTNPSGCYEEVMIVAKAHTAVQGLPEGTGTAYTADLYFPGTGTPFDGGRVVYKGTASGQTVTGLANGTTYFFKAFTRRGAFWSSGAAVQEVPRVVPAPGEIVINQLSPGYAGVRDEYIELVNRSGKTFNLADLAIRVRNGSGNNVVAGGSLSGLMAPYSFWLLSPNAVITVGQTAGLSADGTVDDGFSAQNQQVALVRKTDNTVIDAVGYGSVATPTFTETAPALNPPAGGGLKRVMDGMDHNHNGTDFMRVGNGDIDLRNSRSRLAPEGAVLPGGDFSRLVITGTATLAGSIRLSDRVVLHSGRLSLGDHQLTAPLLLGGSDSAYIKTDGKGMLTLGPVDTAARRFPVGNATYNPVTVSRGSNLAWSVRVTDGFLHEPVPFDPSRAVRRTWEVAPAAVPQEGAHLTFAYNDNDTSQVGKAFNRQAGIQVWNYHAAAWKAASDLQLPEVLPGSLKTAGVQAYKTFSPFTVANGFGALPIRFSAFRADQAPDGTLLSFTNITEMNVDRYTLERSSNGRQFTPIGFLLPAGNNGGPASYSWLDQQRPAGISYYRVRGLERSGAAVYSGVVQVTVERKIKALNIYPSPAPAGKFTWTATLPRGSYLLTVLDSNGQPVALQAFEYGGGHITRTLALPPGTKAGVYTLQVVNGNFMLHKLFVVL